MKILITRHGQTDWNVLRKVQGVTDIELNSVGIEQAKKVGEMLKDKKIDIVFSSPLKRAYRTAELIVENRNIPIIKDNRIIERSFGILEGSTKNEIRGWKESAWRFDKNVNVQGVEEFSDVWLRIKEFLDSLKKDYEDKTVLVVSHGAVSILLKYYFEPDSDKENLYNLSLNNCEVVEYEI